MILTKIREGFGIRLRLIGVLGVICVTLFANSWSNPMILDDLVKIVENPDIRNISRISETLVYPYKEIPNRNRNDPSRPLIYLVYAIVYHFWTIHPVPYHVLNTVVHFGNSVLVFLLMEVIFGNLGVAFLAATLFQILPIQAGVTIYIYSLSDLLSGFFMLLGLYLYIKRNKSGSTLSPASNQERRWSQVPILLCYLGALASKQVGILLPALFGLYDLSIGAESLISGTKNKKSQVKQYHSGNHLNLKTLGQIIWKLRVYALFGMIYLSFRWVYLGGFGDLEGFQQVHDAYDYICVQGLVILKYIQLALIPVGLTIDHGILAVEYSSFILFAAWAVVVGLGFYGIRWVYRGSVLKRRLGFGVLFYLMLVLPTSLIPTVDCLVERRVYLANFGLIYLISVWMSHALSSGELATWLRTHRFEAICGICVFMLYFGVSFRRNEVFASERMIWEESLTWSPGYSRALINAAWSHVMENDFDGGEAMLKEVLHYLPSNTEVLAKLGGIYTIENNKRKDPYTALSYYQRAIEVNPNYYVGRYLAAEVMLRLGRISEAKEMLFKAVETNKSFSPAFVLLSKIAQQEHDFALAESYLKSARQIDPETKPY